MAGFPQSSIPIIGTIVKASKQGTWQKISSNEIVFRGIWVRKDGKNPEVHQNNVSIKFDIASLK